MFKLTKHIFYRMLIIVNVVNYTLTYNSTTLINSDYEDQEAKWTPPSTPTTKVSKELFVAMTAEAKLPTAQRKFKWYSMSSMSVGDKSYVYLAGGLNETSSSAIDLYHFKESILMRCEFMKKPSQSISAQLQQCQIIQKEGSGQFLASSMDSYSYGDEGYLVHCDPFTNKTTVGLGRCSLIQSEGSKTLNIDPCTYDRNHCLRGLRSYFDTNVYRDVIELYIGIPGEGRTKKYDVSLNSNFRLSETGTYDKREAYGWSMAPSKSKDKNYISSLIGTVAEFPKFERLNTGEKEQLSFFGFQVTILFKTFRKATRTSVRDFSVLVSAPFMPSNDLANAGAVYLFCTKSVDIQDTIHGLENNEYFGYSVANIGDINDDDIDDYAIGSPFLDYGNKGTVQIFLSKDSCESMNKQPIQIITNKKVSRFGIGLSAGADFDKNGNNDLVVMSRETDEVSIYFLRKPFVAKCQFSILKNIKNIKKGNEITVLANVQLSREKVSDEKFVPVDDNNLLHQVNPDVLSKSGNRFDFQSKNVQFQTHSGNKSFSVQFNLIANSDAADMDFETQFLVAYRFLFDCSKIDCDKYIYWNECSSVLKLEQFNCDPLPKCSADLKLEANDIFSQEHKMEFMNNKDYLREYKVVLTNNGPTFAIGATLKVKTTGLIKVNFMDLINSTINTVEKRINDQEYELALNSDIFPTNLSNNQNEIIVLVKAYFHGLNNERQRFDQKSSIEFNFSSIIPDSDTVNNVKTIPYEVIFKPKLSISAYTAPKSKSDNRLEPPKFPTKFIQAHSLGPTLEHIYAIENTGQSVLNNVIIKAWIPVLTEKDDPIVYLFKTILSNSSEENALPRVTLKGNVESYCTVNSTWLNPNHFLSQDSHSSHGDNDKRRKRSVTVDSSSAKPKKKVTSSFILSTHKVSSASFNEIRCNSINSAFGIPKCALATCRVSTLLPGQPVHLEINGWVYISTFFKYSINEPEIHTDIKVIVPDPPAGVKVSPDANIVKLFQMSQTYFFGGVNPIERNVILWWPIILGIILGVLFLLLVVFILWKLGFFRRSQMPRSTASRVNYRNDDSKKATTGEEENFIKR